MHRQGIAPSRAFQRPTHELECSTRLESIAAVAAAVAANVRAYPHRAVAALHGPGLYCTVYDVPRVDTVVSDGRALELHRSLGGRRR